MTMNFWIKKYSVNCYFCGKLFDERDGEKVNRFNGNGGEEICPACLEKREDDWPSAEPDHYGDAQ